VTSIGSWAFAYCTNLREITIPESVTGIGTWAFFDCGKLTVFCEPHSAAYHYAQYYGLKAALF
jgi:hypothetical protein